MLPTPWGAARFSRSAIKSCRLATSPRPTSSGPCGASASTSTCSRPAATVMASLRDDLLFIEPVIGAGEIAISDKRTLQPDARALASVIVDTYVGGTLSRKAGVTHIHVGEGADRLAPIRQVLDEFDV